MTPPASPPSTSPHREWMPRIWQGCDLFAWLRLAIRNRCAIHPKFLYIASNITAVSVFHTVLRTIQDQWLANRVDRTPILEQPLFIIGHWRTGTTLLHELLILDERHNCPNTYQCLAPNHFLLTEKVLAKLFWFLLPSHRPMDNMAAGWDKPQEDEFALCMLGQPSPYLTIAFPNHPPQDHAAFDIEGLSARDRASWKKAFVRFLRQLTYKDSRRLILKSPTHSCRIPTLLELFPDARFVHIVRDPYTVFHSTVNLWKTLYETHGLQVPTCRGLEEYVFETFNHLYDRIEATRRLIPPGHFHEMKYEDLVRDPLKEMAGLYDGLHLGGFDKAQPRLDAYFGARKDYRTNKYPSLTPETRVEITRRWGTVIDRYGYRQTPPA